MGVLDIVFRKKVVNLTKIEIDCYKSIDEMPVYNWFKINESNNVKWLLKQDRELTEMEVNELLDQWQTVFFEWIDTFGIPDKMRQVLELKRDIWVLEKEMYLEKDPSKQTFIDIKKYELEQLLKAEEKEHHETANVIKAHIEKFMGFRVPEKETSVKEFYSYLELVKRANQSTQVESTNDE